LAEEVTHPCDTKEKIVTTAVPVDGETLNEPLLGGEFIVMVTSEYDIKEELDTGYAVSRNM
jgi:hypothetical protein